MSPLRVAIPKSVMNPDHRCDGENAARKDHPDQDTASCARAAQLRADHATAAAPIARRAAV
jgi:hypothetical protein